ncbi:MAG: IPT/TIG domain-containing protein, partial [Bdellovibrionota bacterium]
MFPSCMMTGGSVDEIEEEKEQEEAAARAAEEAANAPAAGSTSSSSSSSSAEAATVPAAPASETPAPVTAAASSSSQSTTPAPVIAAAPTVASLSPKGSLLAGGVTVTIVGTGFQTGASATLGGRACTGATIAADGLSLVCTAPAADAAANVDAVVLNPDSQNGKSSGVFSYYATAFAGSPTTRTLSVNNSATIVAQGGVSPYAYSVASGSGLISPSTGYYTAPTGSGTATIQVSDAIGNLTLVTVTVNPALAISPSSRLIAINNSITFSATGGVGGTSYTVTSGAGSVNASTGVYVAPASSGSATVQALDTFGNQSNASITINPALAISPTNVSVTVYGTHQFSGSGGVAPYSFSMQSGVGGVSGAGLYTAPSTPGLAQVRLHDSYGNSASAAVTVTAASAVTLGLNGSASNGAGTCTGAYTIQARDVYGLDSVLASDTAINLSGGGSGSFYASAGCASGTISSVTVINGAGTATFYYKNNAAQSVTLVADDAGALSAGSRAVAINPGASVTLALTGAANQTASTCSAAPYAIDAKDVLGNASPVGGSTVITLSINGSAQLYTDSGCANGTGTVTILNGQSAAAVYFKDTVAESVTFAVSAAGYTGASKNITVDTNVPAKLLVLGSGTLTAGVCSTTAFTARVADSADNTTNATSQTQVTLTGFGAGTFYVDSGCASSVANVTIANGSSSTNFYYKSNSAETVTFSATTGGLTQGTKGVTIAPAAASVLAMAGATPLTAGTCSATAYTVTTKDAFGNVSNVGGTT